MKKIFTFLFLLISAASFSQSTTLVISQVYGAGGNSGATLNADYVELHNVSTTSQSLSGLSIQYGSASNTTWTGVFALPAVSIPAGGYYLIQMSDVGANGTALPTPDVVAAPSIAMGATAGKVALVNGTTALTACSAANIIDLLGYGTATCSEGSAAAAPSPILAVFRGNNGCTETNSNSADFSTAAPAPRNSASPVFICTGGSSTTVTAGTVTDFGNVVVLTNSPSQSFTISGSNLTGFPGSLTVTAPSTDFQVSNDNTNWGASTTISFTSATLASTQVWVRFTPQSLGLKTGNVSITGGGLSSPVLVAVRGTGVSAATPSLTTTSLTGFGNVCIGSTAGPNSITITGNNLTNANVTVGPLAGYTFSATAGGPFTSTLTLPQGGGSFSGTVFVNFTPTAVQSYNGNIPVSGGGATSVNISATGSGVNTRPTVVTGGASAIGFTTATLAGSISAIGCSPVTAYGVEYSTVNGFTTGTVAASTNLTAGAFTSNVSGLAPGTTYYYKAFATNAGGTAYGMQMQFTTASPTINTTLPDDFGEVCVGTTAGPNMFTLTSSDVTNADITVGPLDGFTFSTTANGTYSPTLVINQSGGTLSQDVYVQFTPTANGSYSGLIPVTGGGALPFTVSVAGSGADVPAVVVTGTTTPLIITPQSVQLFATIETEGCSPVTESGFVYSGINSFPVSMGTYVTSTSTSGSDFSSVVNNLVPSTTYYYRAYVKTATGITYGEEEIFRTGDLRRGFVIYGNPVSNGILHFTLTNAPADHFNYNIFNSAGQVVMRRSAINQVGYLDYTINISALPAGVYHLEIRGYNGFKAMKSFIKK